MAPTPLVQQLLAEQLGSQPAGQAGWLLDGTPRNPEQAMWMLGARSRGTMRLDGVLVLDVPPDVLARRIAARVVCGTCGRIGAGTGGPCTSGYCSGVLAPRPEDQNAEATARRQAVYLEQTTPALRILQHAGVPVVHLDGNRPMEEVVDDALRFWSALRSLTQHPQAATR
jgi:adenylate kinase